MIGMHEIESELREALNELDKLEEFKELLLKTKKNNSLIQCDYIYNCSFRTKAICIDEKVALKVVDELIKNKRDCVNNIMAKWGDDNE